MIMPLIQKLMCFRAAGLSDVSVCSAASLLLTYDTGHRDTGHGDKHTVYLSKPGARSLTWSNRICCFYDVFQVESAWLQYVP